MQNVTRNITVDLSRKSCARFVFATQNDINSRSLLISLTDDGKPYAVSKNTTVTVNFKCSDDSRWSYLAEVLEDGRLHHIISPNVLATEGQTLATVTLFDKLGNKLTSSPFVIDVAATLYSESELSDETKLSYVDELIARFAYFNDNELLRIDAEKTRVSNESARKEAEGERVLAESARESRIKEINLAESLRRDRETERGINENARSNAEAARISAERQRAESEAKRQAAYGDLESALDAIIEIQNALMGGGV